MFSIFGKGEAATVLLVASSQREPCMQDDLCQSCLSAPIVLDNQLPYRTYLWTS